MVHLYKNNKIKINADKTHVIFNEYNPGDCIRLNDMTIQAAESVRYLGAELITNDAENNSTCSHKWNCEKYYQQM